LGFIPKYRFCRPAKRPASDQPATTNKKDKKGKKGKNNRKKSKFIPPTLQEVTDYAHKNNYKVDPKQFHKYYSESEPPWHDQHGKPVRSWKQKMIAVWVKPEEKQTQLPFDAEAARQRDKLRGEK